MIPIKSYWDGIILIEIILNSTNYVVCTQEMSGFLKDQKLWCYATIDISQPLKSDNMDTSKCIEMLEE